MPKKIVYCTPSLYIAGGVERVLTTHVNWLAEHTDFEIVIILTDGMGKEPYYPLSQRVKIINLDIGFEQLWGMPFIKKGMTYLKKQRVYRQRLRETLMSLHPDITMSLLRREINFLCDIPDGSQKWGWLHVCRTNYRNFEAGDTNFMKKIFAKFWMRSLVKQLKRLDKFFVLSEEDKRCWTELSNVQIMPNPLPFWSDKTSKLGGKRVIAVGRYAYQKGFDLLLPAWQHVQKKHPDWELYIYGNGERGTFEKQAKELSIQSTCHLEAAVSNIIDKYCESNIFVLSSRFEGFGMVLIEAMNCGVPCVSFACPCGPSDIIQDGKNGLLVKNGDINGLAKAICQLIEDKNLCKRMAVQARQDSATYAVDNIMHRWMNVYNGK